jgi:hypothetical protein
VNAGDVRSALRRRHREGTLIFELRTGTGYMAGEPSRIDAWHMEDVLSSGLLRTSYEIKVTRADFKREVADSRKRRLAMLVSNVFYFAAPRGVVPVDEVPPECGLLELREPGEWLETTVKAPYRDGGPSSWHFLASALRRVREER